MTKDRAGSQKVALHDRLQVPQEIGRVGGGECQHLRRGGGVGEGAGVTEDQAGSKGMALHEWSSRNSGV